MKENFLWSSSLFWVGDVSKGRGPDSSESSGVVPNRRLSPRGNAAEKLSNEKKKNAELFNKGALVFHVYNQVLAAPLPTLDFNVYV